MAANSEAKQALVGLVVLGIIGAVVYAVVQMEEHGVDKADVAPAPPVARTDDDTGDGEQVVLETIATPSTARFVSSNVVAREGTWRMVHVVVDAQNNFGAMLRKSLCVTYFREGTKIRWSKDFGMQECSKPPTDAEVVLLKGLNSWPSAPK